MTILIIEHDDLDQPFRFGDLLTDAGAAFERVLLYEDGVLPDAPEDLRAIVSLGGPQNVDETDQHPWMSGEMEFLARAQAADVPVIGVCLGAQLLAEALGGSVGKVEGGPEIGFTPIERSAEGAADPVMSEMPAAFRTIQCHGYEVQRCPVGASASLASSVRTPVQAYRIGKSYGLQFHPEWTRSAIDAAMTKNMEWAVSSGMDPSEIEGGVERDFARYRSESDRLIRTIIQQIR